MEVDGVGQVALPARDQPGIAGHDQRLATERLQARKIGGEDPRHLHRQPQGSGACDRRVVEIVDAVARTAEEFDRLPALGEKRLEDISEKVDSGEGEAHSRQSPCSMFR